MGNASGPTALPPDPNTRPISIEIRGLAKKYGDVVALHPIDLEVREGEFLTLLGPSGSGKTTLLQLVAGLTAPTQGRLKIRGRDATDLHPSRRDIGLVFQNYALFPHLTIFENIAFPLRMRNLPNDEVKREVTRALDMVHLPQIKDRTPKELSGGQQQRVALARCLVYRPSVILMDEPLGALDKKLREHMQLEIKRIHRDVGTTIVYVTHDQEEALSMSDRICLMSDGAIAQYGTPKDLYFSPKSAFVADFMGQPNLIAGRIVSSTSKIAKVATEQGEFEAAFDGPIRADQDVKVLIRSEKLRIYTGSEPSANRLAARILDVSPIGALTKVTLQTALGLTLVATFLSEADDDGLEIGQAVRLGWNAQDAQVLAAGR
jgi:putative spermidine/putrescine transport system ATP-binding protein